MSARRIRTQAEWNVDTHISRLRKKIDEGFASPLLHTLRGTGYRLSTEP